MTAEVGADDGPVEYLVMNTTVGADEGPAEGPMDPVVKAADGANEGPADGADEGPVEGPTEVIAVVGAVEGLAVLTDIQVNE